MQSIYYLDGDSYMKKLVIFYSFEGNTKYIAENIAEAVGADILELKPKKDVSSGGFMKYLWGGRQVVLGKKPELTAMREELKENYILGEIEFVDPIKGQQGKASMAKEWALEMVNK